MELRATQQDGIIPGTSNLRGGKGELGRVDRGK